MPFCGTSEAYFRVAIVAAGAVVLAVGMDPAAAVGTKAGADATSTLGALWSDWVNPLLPSKPSLTLLERDTSERYWTRVALIVVGYMMMYLGPAAFFELTNPKPLTEARRKSIEGELRLGVMAMTLNTVFACLWMTFVDPYTPFYGFFHKGDAGLKSWWGFESGHEHTVVWFACGMLAYGVFFDWWFWWTHLVLHWPWCFKHIHSIHHELVNPTAFAQDAVHPVEGIVQGPLGHYLAACAFPMHPAAHALFGFFTSTYAIAAHDGRAYDLAEHTIHHHHKEANFGLYGCFDCLCGTRYRPGYNPTVRGLAMTRVLQFDDVYSQADLAKGLRRMAGGHVIKAIREEVAAARQRLHGKPAAAQLQADADVDSNQDEAESTSVSDSSDSESPSEASPARSRRRARSATRPRRSKPARD